MAKRSKKYELALKKIEAERLYGLEDACRLASETSLSKFDGSIDLAVNLGVDPRHADQNVRGAVSLPKGLGRTVRIVVFAKGEKAVEASKESVEFVGGEDLMQKIQGGWMDFDQVLATPDMMGVVGRLGKVLGPRGLMPNPKTGTVTFEVAKAIRELKAGRVEFRVEKAGIVHAPVGKVSFNAADLAENARTVLDALVRSKPSTSKGTYLKKCTVSATMGPGVLVELAPFRG